MKYYTNEELSKELEKKEKRSQIFNILILYPIVILIVLAFGSIAYQKLALGEEYISLAGFKAFRIVTGSMEPTIKIGDLVIIKETDSSNIEVGDVITFDEGGMTVTHRIIDIVKENGIIKYKTKGDNNSGIDLNLVEPTQIEGKLCRIIPQFGSFIGRLSSQVGITITVIFLLLVYLRMKTSDDRRYQRRLIREKYKAKVK